MVGSSFQVEIVKTEHQNFHALRRKLVSRGHTEQQIIQEFNELATAHNSGKPPKGAGELEKTKSFGYSSYGWKIFGFPITYHVREADWLIVVEAIDASN